MDFTEATQLPSSATSPSETQLRRDRRSLLLSTVLGARPPRSAEAADAALTIEASFAA